MTDGVGPAADSPLGTLLRSRRLDLGATLAQASAATRVRVANLAAIEDGEFDRLPAFVYARGYVRTYSRYLGLDPDEMVLMLPVPPAHARRSLALDGSQPNARLTLTTPVAVALSVALLAGAFGYYAWRQIESVNPGSTSPAAARALAVPSTTPLPSPSPIRHAIVVVVRVTDTVWLNVIVDGKAQYSDSGHVFQPGAEVSFQGFDIKITSGKGAATFITIDDRPIGAMGNGVVTREYKASQ